ncbi:phosphoglycerate kinase [Cohnella kolymensis]|uniref:Phosphoglycerate kinase n=1 Tax=Cohnella kolymensis TaxID=1590652 RepID=A0ABR5A8U4_9BACL|nr:histidine phosphatase family protein [Cohnella kolymensis]KIL37486.1 phosphoglycerate kinase [Cohnella kolymensis]
MIRIGFIRHGTTEWNLQGRMQGLTDISLAEIGRDQAILLGKSLQPADWDGILSSDLTRAAQTAELLASSSAIPFLGVDARLRERGFGMLEGTTLPERVARWGENWRQLDLGREKLDSLLVRWDSFLEENSRIHAGKRILIVSHGGLIEPVLANRYGTVVQQHLTNTSLSVLDFYESGWRCDLLNCSKHLKIAQNEI